MSWRGDLCEASNIGRSVSIIHEVSCCFLQDVSFMKLSGAKNVDSNERLWKFYKASKSIYTRAIQATIIKICIQRSTTFKIFRT